MTDQYSTFRKIFGNEYSDNSEILDVELLKIQEKYKVWFEKNNGEHEDGSKKTILDYRVLYNNSNEVIFKMDYESIPQEIYNDINHSFNEIFKKE